MTIIIYIILLLMVLISGLMAVSPQETKKESNKEETVMEKIGLINTAEVKKNLYSRLISLTVFVLSLASLMAMYFIKG